MLPELQIRNPSNSIGWSHSAHSGDQGLQVLSLEKLHPLGQRRLLVVVPVQAEKMDRSCYGLQENWAPESYGCFTRFLIVAHG